MKQTQLSFLSGRILGPALAASLCIAANAQSGPTAFPSTPGSAPSASPAQPHRQGAQALYLQASRVIGMNVRNAQGGNIGQIGDLVVNLNDGNVRYAILRADPGILSPDKLFAVPTTQLRLAPGGDALVSSVPRERLQQGVITVTEWNDTFFGDPQRIARLDKAWGVGERVVAGQVRRASDLIGKEVKSRSGEELGTLEEMVVDLAHQRVHYAVLYFDPSWAGPEKRVLFPLRTFYAGVGDEKLTLNVDKAVVREMKDFTRDRYANLNDPVWVTEVDRHLAKANDPRQDTRAAGAAAASNASNSGEPLKR